MAARLQSVTVTQPAAGQIRIAIGNVLCEFPIGVLRGTIEQGAGFESLLFQIILKMRENNFNPSGKTLLQIKTFIESHQYLWGA